jgi:3-dehydroquinate synthase
MTAPVLISLSDALARLQAEPECYLVYDRNAAWVASSLMERLPVCGSLAIETSEEGKTLETVQSLERWLLQADATRGALLLAVGGGITTDLVGFAAAIYKRGIRYANFPTTLLAQVDAAIGGKTGVNLDGYKNMLGAFRMPEFTVLEASFLRTLPAREWRDGLAEMLKTFLLADPQAYRQALDLFSSAKPALFAPEGPENAGPSAKPAFFAPKGPENACPSAKPALFAPEMARLVRRAAEIKEAIVKEDPYDKGVRMQLNLGHTFAHAIERVQAQRADGNPLKHGEAVAVGMVLAARLSERLGMAEKGLAARLEQGFQAVGLPVQSPVTPEELLDAMRKDKKAVGGKLRMVLPAAPGEVIVKELEINDLHFNTT